jgi:NADPH:quinone reductase-like Zn-dependent oxidoreductase
MSVTITAVGVTTYGGPEVLQQVQLPEPHAGAGQVRVRVRAAGVNPVDAMMRTGLLAGMYDGVTPPFVPGMEVAGTIDEMGENVDPALELSVGLRVVGFVDFAGSHGGYSEAVVLPAASVTRAPEGATDAEAASFLNNALTARNTLDALALPAGATLLVTGAAGAVGGYLTELGAAEGLQVVAVAGVGDEELVRGFGAHEFVARGEDVAARVRALVPDGVDALADAATLGAAAVAAVRDGGQIGALRPWDASVDRGITVHQLNVRRRAADAPAIAALRDRVEAGRLALRVADVVPAARAADAHALMDKGGVRGRLVLDFTGGAA